MMKKINLIIALLIANFCFAQKDVCSAITTYSDKFNGETIYQTPETDGIILMKILKGSDTSFMLMQTQFGSTAEVDKKGLYILMKNNKRIDYPDADVRVKVSPRGDGYLYTSAITLAPEDIALLCSNEITDTRVYVYDRSVDEGGKLMNYLKCLVNK